jgi:hypothetical protein
MSSYSVKISDDVIIGYAADVGRAMEIAAEHAGQTLAWWLGSIADVIYGTKDYAPGDVITEADGLPTVHYTILKGQGDG